MDQVENPRNTPVAVRRQVRLRANHSVPTPRALRNDPPPAITEADGRKPVAPRAGPKDDLVAVLQVGACLAGGQAQLSLPVMRQLAEAAIARLVGRGYRAAAEEIAWLQVAAAARVVRDHLRESP